MLECRLASAILRHDYLPPSPPWSVVYIKYSDIGRYILCIYTMQCHDPNKYEIGVNSINVHVYVGGDKFSFNITIMKTKTQLRAHIHLNDVVLHR